VFYILCMFVCVCLCLCVCIRLDKKKDFRIGLQLSKPPLIGMVFPLEKRKIVDNE